MKWSVLAFLALCCAGSLLTCGFSAAEEPTTPPPAKNPPPAVEKGQEKDPDKDPPPDDPLEKKNSATRYELPTNADSDALVEFCQRLQEYEPEDDADALLHERRMPKAIRKACRRIVQMEKDLESENGRFARRILLADRLDTHPDFEAARTTSLLKQVHAFLTSPKAAGVDADVAAALSDYLGDHISPKSIEWCNKTGKALAGNPDPDLSSAGKILLGTGRRLNLIGKPLPLKGTTLDGKAFDLASLNDRVVLVVFWATWCEHCDAENKNLLRLYESFHDKGFEVVAISADEDRGEVQTYVKEERIPWINLHEKGGKHPALDEWGIGSFPSTILIDKDGHVTALDLRETALGDKIGAFFGVAPSVKESAKAEKPHKRVLPNDSPKGEAKKDDPQSADELKKKYSF